MNFTCQATYAAALGHHYCRLKEGHRGLHLCGFRPRGKDSNFCDFRWSSNNPHCVKPRKRRKDSRHE